MGYHIHLLHLLVVPNEGRSRFSASPVARKRKRENSVHQFLLCQPGRQPKSSFYFVILVFLIVSRALSCLALFLSSRRALFNQSKPSPGWTCCDGRDSGPRTQRSARYPSPPPSRGLPSAPGGGRQPRRRGDARRDDRMPGACPPPPPIHTPPPRLHPASITRNQRPTRCRLLRPPRL